MSLTDTQIRQAKSKDKTYKLSDGKGLFLQVTHTGAKYWRLKYRIAGKEKLLSIGVYPSISLKKARKACADAKDLLEQGIDPSQAKQSKKLEQVQAQANNLDAISREWQKQQALTWSVNYSYKVLRSLERDLLPYLGTLPLGDITPPKLLAVLRRVEARGAAESAHRLKQIVGAVFRFAVATGRAEGLLKAVNLGGDADTVGAIYGQLAGAYYGLDSIPIKWMRGLASNEKIGAICNELIMKKE